MSLSVNTIPGVSCRRITADHHEYDSARQAWNLVVDQQPAAVAFPTSAADVAGIVSAAARVGLRVAVQGGGHNMAPLGDLADTILVRTSQMSSVRVHVAARTARVEAGALWGPVVDAAARADLYPLHGSSPDVGVVGYSLHGGLGWAARRHGLQSSRILGAELVTGEGEHVRVDADHEPELLWALRGGGAVGVVTALEFELLPITHAYAGWLAWDWSESERVLRRWSEWTRDAPESATTAARILKLPDAPGVPGPMRGRQLVAVDGAVLADTPHAEAILRSLRELRPEIDTFATVPAATLSRLHGDPEEPLPVVTESAMLGRLDAAAVAAFVHAAGPGSGSSLLMAELRHLGGALRRPAAGGGALAALDGEFLVHGGAVTPDRASLDAGRADAGRLVAAMADWAEGRPYANFTEAPVDPRSFHSAHTRGRLTELRDRVDPRRVLRVAHDEPVPARA